MLAISPVKRCQICIASWKDKAQKVRIFRRDPEPQPSHSDDLNPDAEDEAIHDREDSEDEEAFRGRRRTRSPSQEPPSESSLRLKSASPRPSSCSSMSPFRIPRLRRPDPDMSILPALSPKQHNRYSRLSKKYPRNASSRTSLITADSVPQFDWTRADCCDWISVFMQTHFANSARCANLRAARNQEHGQGLYHTSLWHWRDRCGYVTGEVIYYHLYQCRDGGMVRALDPKDFDQGIFHVPPGYEWEGYVG